MNQLNPNDYIITRKRKKYKFALFANSPLCFEFDEWKNEAVDVVEVGAGTGLFSVELAVRHPDKMYVAIDVKADRLQKGANEAELRGIHNVRFIRARADQLGELFSPSTLDGIWVTFPDPFPKKRAAGRRLTHATYLAKYKQLLKEDGSLCLKHDDKDFFCWSLEELVSQSWTVEELSFDLHDSNMSDEYKIKTTYELRWLSEGKQTNFVKALPKS